MVSSKTTHHREGVRRMEYKLLDISDLAERKTLRDEMAMAALPAIIGQVRGDEPNEWVKSIPAIAYSLADLMLKERNRK